MHTPILRETSDKILAAGISKPVISWIFPETQELVKELWASAPVDLYKSAYTGWQDSYHLAFMDKWLSWASPVVKLSNPETFPYRYWANGSTEAIRDSLASYAVASYAKNTKPRIHVFYGEYEGYERLAEGYQIEVIHHDRSKYVPTLKNSLRPTDRFYISQPSAIDGNIWSGYSDWLDYMLMEAPQTKIMLDLCYVGTTTNKKDLSINLDYPNIQTVFFGLSKVFGVYYHRIGGAISRRALPGLEGNIWFKNMFSLALGTELLNRYSIFDLPTRYAEDQVRAASLASTKLGFTLVPSDVLILAYCPKNALPAFAAPLLRGPVGVSVFRACLTPTLDQFHA